MIDEVHTGIESEGKDNGHPIILSGISASDMTSFLDVLNASFFLGPPSLSFSQYAAALHLATMWSFDDLRNGIISHMDTLTTTADPFERIDVSLRCRVEKWLHPAYADLCKREGALQDDEVERLGLKRAAAIWRVREHVTTGNLRDMYSSQLALYCTLCDNTNVECRSCGRIMDLDDMAPYLAGMEVGNALDLIKLEPALEYMPEYDFESPALLNDLSTVQLKSKSRKSTMPSEHPKYGNASYMVFLVEDNLFHIPIRRLKQSQYFRDMIEEAHTGMESEGKDNGHPIFLSGISAFELTSFLDALDASFISGDPKLDFTQWAAALHLATMWNFDEARENIIAHMAKTITRARPIDRVDTSLKCHVEKWLHPAYEALCLQAGGLKDDDVERLGLKRSAAIWRIRESLEFESALSGCPTANCSSKTLYCEECGRAHDLSRAVDSTPGQGRRSKVKPGQQRGAQNALDLIKNESNPMQWADKRDIEPRCLYESTFDRLEAVFPVDVSHDRLGTLKKVDVAPDEEAQAGPEEVQGYELRGKKLG
ncbi:hypothetical protein FRB90_005475 [Tulasnella sp. 427]|nr:hypothetical protein FRB90_005475 [Tulasnella sp. 427]